MPKLTISEMKDLSQKLQIGLSEIEIIETFLKDWRRISKSTKK